jgi:hypothetical protein
LDVCILQYLWDKYPTITKAQASEQKSVVVRKPYLASLSRRFGLADHIVTFKRTKHTDEDVMESFLGATVIIGDKVVATGFGFTVVLECLTWIFDQVDFGRVDDLPPAPAITWVNQSFVKLGFGSNTHKQVFVRQEPDRNNQMFTVSTVYVSQTTLTKLRDFFGIKLHSTVLGVASEVDKKLSEQKAFQVAYSLLNRSGMTPDWVKKAGDKLLFQRPAIQPFYEQALAKAKKMGYDDISYVNSTAQGTYGNQVATLVGLTKEGKKSRIAVGQGEDRNTAMAIAIQNFVEDKC